MYGELKTGRTLVELGVDKEAKDDVVRNLMMMMIISMVVIMMMIVVVDKSDCR